MDLKELSKKYQEEAIKTLEDVIKINSVYDETTKNEKMPYGKGVFDVMEYIDKVATSNGFKVDRCDNRCVEISYGEGEQDIGIFAHLDVVPVSGEWEYPPFSATIHDGKMYGRGTSDDKGPAIAAFYALRMLKDNDLIKDFKVRLVLGGDEERGSSCLEYYFNELKKPQPTYGFTPDGDFPLIYGEKGITNFTYEGKLDLYPVVKIDAGVVANSVIDKAILVVEEKEDILNYLNEHPEIKFNILDEDYDSLTIEFIGKACHGSYPQGGINSGLILLNVIAEVYQNKEIINLSNSYKDPFGKAMGEYYETEYLGNTTYNVGIIKYDNQEFKMIVNFRFPENVKPYEVIDRINEKTTLNVLKADINRVLYFDPNQEFIKALYDVYTRNTNDFINKPMTIGGGTYAKECENTIAFGSHFPGKVDNIHSPNEKIDLEDFYNSIPLYADAILTLGKLK